MILRVSLGPPGSLSPFGCASSCGSQPWGLSAWRWNCALHNRLSDVYCYSFTLGIVAVSLLSVLGVPHCPAGAQHLVSEPVGPKPLVWEPQKCELCEWSQEAQKFHTGRSRNLVVMDAARRKGSPPANERRWWSTRRLSEAKGRGRTVPRAWKKPCATGQSAKVCNDALEWRKWDQEQIGYLQLVGKTQSGLQSKLHIATLCLVIVKVDSQCTRCEESLRCAEKRKLKWNWLGVQICEENIECLHLW